jgi:WD40 repeat protein/tRNA A-37 threonylcarbamoyl transferase component Bud32
MTEAPSNHPSDEALCALSLGQLSEAELTQVSAHLDDCPVCCRRIDQLATDDRLLTRLQQGAATREKALVGAARRRSAVRALDHSQEATRKRAVESAPTILPSPKQVGDYEILGEVGRGGMGVVYRVRHRGLHRLAALKMVLAGEFASPTQELRFRLEAELAARVQHPNIVQVYEIGSYEGRPFLALEWVEGGSLANRLDGKPWPPDEAAALIETLARAIDVAHSEGVVHRDLKPANILLSREWGVRSEEKRTARSPLPTPKITDFGLAQTIEGGRTMTQSGFLVGTPGYMAPEQAGGKRALVGPATDIYALGVVLYQLLTGQLPFERDSTLELLRAVTSDDPPRPRRLQPRLPRDLEAITLHCLEKEPGRRYPTAMALAEDLRRFQEGKQVVARPVGAIARFGRVCRRRPLITLLVGLLAVSLFGGLAGVTWKWLEANEQRDLANAEKDAAQFQAYRASLAAASASLQNHDVAGAERHLKAGPVGLQGWEFGHLRSRLDDSSAVVPLPPGESAFLIAAPFTQSSPPAAGDQVRLGILTPAGLRIVDLEGREERTVPIDPERRLGFSVAQTKRGLRVVARGANATLDLLDETGQLLCRTEIDYQFVAISPDATRLCVRHGPRQLAVLDASSGKQTATCVGHDKEIWTYCFSPDGARLASGSEDGTVLVWDTAGTLLAICQGHTSKVLRVAFSPDGSRLVTTSADGTVRQWDPITGQEVEPPYDRHSNDVFSAVYSPDGQWVASAGFDRTIRVWQASGRQDVTVLHGHTGGVIDLAFAADGRRLASLSQRTGFVATADDTVRVWEVDPQASLPVLRGHTSYVYPLAYSPDGRWLASGSWDDTVRLWDAATGELCATLPHPPQSLVFGLAFGPDGSWLVTGCRQNDWLRVWDVATARVRNKVPSPRGNVLLNSLTVSPDGTRVAVTEENVAFKDHCLTVCDIASGKPLFSSKGSVLAYSPGGRWLAVRAADLKTVLLLDARTHETIARITAQENLVGKAAFSPDSHLLAVCGEDRTICLLEVDRKGWRVEGKDGRALRGHTDEVFAVAFHPDGTRLATAGRDGAVWLWDLARDKLVANLPGHNSYIWSLAFSPDGATLASGSGDYTVRLWDTAPLKARYDARREAAALQPEADRLVERLWREKNDLDQVVRALRDDLSLNEALRHAALRAVQRRFQPAGAAPGKPRDPP